MQASNNNASSAKIEPPAQNSDTVQEVQDPTPDPQVEQEMLNQQEILPEFTVQTVEDQEESETLPSQQKKLPQTKKSEPLDKATFEFDQLDKPGKHQQSVREEPRDLSGGRTSSRVNYEDQKTSANQQNQQISQANEKPTKKKGKKTGAATNKKPNVTKKFKNQSPAKLISSGPQQEEKRNSTVVEDGANAFSQKKKSLVERNSRASSGNRSPFKDIEGSQPGSQTSLHSGIEERKKLKQKSKTMGLQDSQMKDGDGDDEADKQLEPFVKESGTISVKRSDSMKSINLKEDSPEKVLPDLVDAEKSNNDGKSNKSSDSKTSIQKPTNAIVQPEPYSSKRVYESSSDNDELYESNGQAKEWEIVVPAMQKKLDETIEKKLAELMELHPPNPIMPKSQRPHEAPRSGGSQNFMRLMKFRGQDYGKSEFRRREQNVDAIKFPEGTSLKTIFTPTPTDDPNSINFWSGVGKPPKQGAIARNYAALNKGSSRGAQKEAAAGAPPQPDKATETQTPAGEIVYLRWALDFSSKRNAQKRDMVIEENLLDVKRLLKTSSVATAESKKNKDEEGKNPEDQEKKALMQVAVDPFYTRKGPDDHTLVFESRFESGNLASVVKARERDRDYLLLLQNDVNTGGHTQWFFFRASNVVTGEVRFNMLNLCKPDSLFNEGMKVLVYSEKKAGARDIGWHRAGTKIYYYSNGVRKDTERKSSTGPFKSYYTHTFTYDFEFPDDTVYFAYCYPYTYTDMLEDLNKISTDQVKSQFCKRSTLCETLAGNKCEVLTITSRQNPDNMAKRKGVIITARVHPGESVGSWMMKGALEFLTDTTSPEAELLRQNYVFKVVPMLNPDGVINGNYRCSLAGCDLNRRWKAPSKVLHPTIYYTKQMIFNFAKERDLAVFCDFHGHSRRKNIFMYGCNVPGSPEDSRLFPFILSNLCPFFIYNNSRFGNQKSKESTARMALFNELRQHPAIYTMESSFCGNDVGQFARYHFSTENLMQTGIDFCRTLLIYNSVPAPLSILENLLKNINGIFHHYKVLNDKLQFVDKDHDVELMKLYHERLEQMHTQGIPINTKQIRKALLNVLRQHSDVVSDGENTSSAGSDNAPSDDNLQLEEIAEVVPILEDPQIKQVLKKQQLDNPDSNAAEKIKKIARSDGTEKKKGKKKKGKAADADSPRNNEPENEQEKPEDLNVAGEEKQDEPEDDTVHKKKLKKNVESKDACTQTDRSDYMLIKQRQKQREAFLQLQAKQQENQGVGSQQPSVDQSQAAKTAHQTSTNTNPQNIKQSRGSKQASRSQANANGQSSDVQQVTVQQPHIQGKTSHHRVNLSSSQMQQQVPQNAIQASNQPHMQNNSLEVPGSNNNRKLVYMQHQQHGQTTSGGQQQVMMSPPQPPRIKQKVAGKNQGIAPTQQHQNSAGHSNQPPHFAAINQQNSYQNVYPTQSGSNHFAVANESSPRQTSSQIQQYQQNAQLPHGQQPNTSQNSSTFSPTKIRRNIRKQKGGATAVENQQVAQSSGQLSQSQSNSNTQSQLQQLHAQQQEQMQQQQLANQQQKASWERVIISSSSRAANSAISQWLIQKNRETAQGPGTGYQHGYNQPAGYQQVQVSQPKTSGSNKKPVGGSSMAISQQPQVQNQAGYSYGGQMSGKTSSQQARAVSDTNQQQAYQQQHQQLQERQIVGNTRYMGQRGAPIQQYGVPQPQTGLPNIVQQSPHVQDTQHGKKPIKQNQKQGNIGNQQQQRAKGSAGMNTTSSLTPHQQKQSPALAQQQQARASTAGRSERINSTRGGNGTTQFLQQSGNFQMSQQNQPQLVTHQHHDPNVIMQQHPIHQTQDHRNPQQHQNAILRTNSLEGLQIAQPQQLNSANKQRPMVGYGVKHEDQNHLRNSSNGFVKQAGPSMSTELQNFNQHAQYGDINQQHMRGDGGVIHGSAEKVSSGGGLQNQFIKQQLEQRQQAVAQQIQHNMNDQQQRILSSNSSKKQGGPNIQMQQQTISPTKQLHSNMKSPEKNSARPPQQMTSAQKQQLIQVQRIVPTQEGIHQQRASAQGQTGNSSQRQSQQQPYQNSETPSKQGVHINIVNFHNEFNITNNVIIQQPAAEQYSSKQEDPNLQGKQGKRQNSNAPVPSQSQGSPKRQGARKITTAGSQQRPSSKQRSTKGGQQNMN